MTRPIKWISITLLVLVVSMCALLFFWPKPSLLEGVSFSRAVYDSNQRLLRLTLSNDSQYRVFTPLVDISPQLITATLLQEDQYFYYHLGVNPISFVKAAWLTYVMKARRIGASTITMQVARIRYGIHSKTLKGKILQIIRALQLELHYSKNQILEAYLNLAPYGNNIEGVGAASHIYFGKSARNLNLPEILTLVVIPQNPNKRIFDRQVLKETRQKLYERWLEKYPEDHHQSAFMSLPLQMMSVRTTPFLAPHFVDEVLNTTPFTQQHIVTTLDLRLQKTIERITQQYLARKAILGVNNAAIMIVDTRDMGVKAMMGSSNFFKASISGQVNGTLAKRSPGSTLKPFIYALAIDQGLIHPATMLKDVPRSFGSYNPENFDNDFVGPISAKEALQLSRNIPAVYLAEQLKSPSLYEFMRNANISDLKSETYYGLALVLGGAELTMHELVNLYATLANEGVQFDLRLTSNQLQKRGKRLLSPEASFLVLDMLTEKGQFPIAWKTGTSSGYRDAWTVGLFGPYVMAVWIGNFDNQSNPAFIGKDIAAPLFFEIAHAIRVEYRALPPLQKHPEQLKLTKVDVCKPSGMLPTRYCLETEKVWFIPGKSPIKTDTIYREIAINTKTGLRTCQFNKETRFAIYEFWSSDLLKIYKQAGIQRRVPPAYDETCTPMSAVNVGFQPQIISPTTHVNYVTRLVETKEARIPFTAVVDADVRYVHWFLNEIYLGKTPRDKPFFWQARPGKYVVRVVDDHGRSDARDLQVKMEG